MTGVLGVSFGEAKWQTLPVTPTLPAATRDGFLPVSGAEIWYAVYGSGDPVILLHGGLANSSYWGRQVPELAKFCQVIVLDSRGHGRSTWDNLVGYDLMVSDVVGVMEQLNITRSAIVGWSDGAITGLKLAMRYPERVSGVFAFGANSSPSGTFDLTNSVMFSAYEARARVEYASLSRTPGGYPAFYDQMLKMWTSEPNMTDRDLQGIQVPVWVVDGDHEEVIQRTDTLFIADNIPNCGLLIQPEVSHFSLLQDPDQFTQDIIRFLQAKGIAKISDALADARPIYA
ncbi:alpha/beta hydrolase [Ensifer adhaerens]|uniref:alpha/beta fold hydrolase n=1 Tax=Ensifer adhaerens TaxID=106592 RepID=UPI0023A93293|nr:alpha/beta hydrolase [Ensifer adhaerens]WDZ78398.1 alpha/beta hydrolase [Ensifer adhaerens]